MLSANLGKAIFSTNSHLVLGTGQGGGTCYNGLYSFNGDLGTGEVTVDLAAPDAGLWTFVELTVHFTSKFGSGWTVGDIGVQWYDVDEWVVLQHFSITTTESAGNENIVVYDVPIDPGFAGGVQVKLTLKGQPGQGDVEPYPLMINYARWRFHQAE